MAWKLLGKDTHTTHNANQATENLGKNVLETIE